MEFKTINKLDGQRNRERLFREVSAEERPSRCLHTWKTSLRDNFTWMINLMGYGILVTKTSGTLKTSLCYPSASAVFSEKQEVILCFFELSACNHSL